MRDPVARRGSDSRARGPGSDTEGGVRSPSALSARSSPSSSTIRRRAIPIWWAMKPAGLGRSASVKVGMRPPWSRTTWPKRARSKESARVRGNGKTTRMPLEGLVVGVDRAVRGGEVPVRHAGHGEDDARRRREGLAVGAELDAREGLENGSSGAFADRPGDPHAIPDRETRREAAAAVVDENPLGSCRISVVVEVFFLHEDALQRIAGATQEAADHDAFDRDTGPPASGDAASRPWTAWIATASRPQPSSSASTSVRWMNAPGRSAEEKLASRSDARSVPSAKGSSATEKSAWALERPSGSARDRRGQAVVVRRDPRPADRERDGLVADDGRLRRRGDREDRSIRFAREGRAQRQLDGEARRTGRRGGGRAPRQRRAEGEVRSVRPAIAAAAVDPMERCRRRAAGAAAGPSKKLAAP
jgi:hypothetical protein